MWLCAIGFLLFFILSFVVAPIVGSMFGIIATLFLCTGLLIENLEKLFKKHFPNQESNKQ